jgi:hypothetical protein
MPGGLGAFALVIAAAALVLILLLVYLLTRDTGVSRTSFGFYVERKRYEEPVTAVHPVVTVRGAEATPESRVTATDAEWPLPPDEGRA